MLTMHEHGNLTPSQASQAGYYNQSTLQCYIRQWRHQANFKAWLDYMIFRRQLGYPLSPLRLQQALQWQRQSPVKRLLNGCFGHRHRQLRNLIDEVQSKQSQQLPPAAVKSPYRNAVSRWRNNAPQVIATLHQQLASAQVTVVGNSPNLAGQNLGQAIDSSDIVIRFNQFASTQTRHEDIGTKHSIWVMAPGYQGPVPADINLVIITGPDMLWWQQRWPQLAEHSADVIGVPLNYWRDCVRLLNAPPSAGFLLVYWLRSFVPHAQLKITGFGVENSQPYHHAIKGHQAVSRHNWTAETTIMKQWISQHSL